LTVFRRESKKEKASLNLSLCGKIMSSCPIFPCPPHGQRNTRAIWGHYPRCVLIPCPRTYFEVEDIRPGEDETQCITDKIFVSAAGGISIPKDLNRNILQFLTGKDLLRFTMVSKREKLQNTHT
jgi:hypothetical protein